LVSDGTLRWDSGQALELLNRQRLERSEAVEPFDILRAGCFERLERTDPSAVAGSYTGTRRMINV
jgi:hypothetical protein